MDIAQGIVMPLLASALACFALMLLLQPLAPRLRLLDHPKGRKDHARPVPVTGGLAMLAAVCAVGFGLFPPGSAWVTFVLAGLLLVGVGVLDDLYDLRWWWRIGAQVLAALVMAHGGVRVEQIGPAFGLDEFSLGYLSVPFTVFATVGLINAINMIDGKDGLAGGLVLACLLMTSAAAVYAGNLLIAERAAVICGALLAFLWFNWRFPWRRDAHAFMGNSGSAFLGLVVAWLTFRLTQNSGHPVNPVLALWLLPVPVIDCLVLILRRLQQGRSPFAADRNHIHHLMTDAGYCPARIGLSLAAFSFGCGLFAALCMVWDVPNPVLLAAYFALAAAWYGVTHDRARAVALFRRLGGKSIAMAAGEGEEATSTAGAG